MKFFVATVLLATCLVAQAKNIGEGRIISGTPAVSGQIPYQAALWRNLANGQRGFCGGTLISSKWILTGARCVVGVESFDIKLGGIRTDQDEPGQVVLTSTKSIVHPAFDSSNLNNDVALIELPADVAFSDKIQPLALPRKSDAGDRFENIRARVSGWGWISDYVEGVNPTLNYVDLDTITNTECMDTYGWSIIDSTICCKGRPEHTPCNGDSGGPLVRTADDGELTHIGVVSFVHKLGCATGYPSAYARTTSFLDWISQQTGIPVRP